MDPAAPAFWLPLLEIIWIDILLSGDNAVPGKQINEQKHSLEINWRRRQAHRDCEFIGQLNSAPGRERSFKRIDGKTKMRTAYADLCKD